MPVALLFENPNVTQEQYEATRRTLGVDADHMPEGAILHMAGPSAEGGWRVFEIWETEAAALKFNRERLEPLFKVSGRDLAVPKIWAIHSLIQW